MKDIDMVIEWIDEYGCEAKLNGRQIRNIISSGRILESNNAGTHMPSLKTLKCMTRYQRDFGEQLESLTTASRMIDEEKR